MRCVLPLIVLSFAGFSSAQDRSADAPTQRRVELSDSTDRERERLRAEFLSARQEFVELMVSALTSEELAERVREFSSKRRLGRAEEDLGLVRERLAEVDEAQPANSDQARRLAGRQLALEGEIRRLRESQVVEGSKDSSGGLPEAQALAGLLQKEMSEETEFLADVLDEEELRDRTKRLRRLVTIARVANGFRHRPSRSQVPEPRKDSDVVPAGGTVELGVEEPGAGEGDALGPATTVPPVLPDTSRSEGAQPGGAATGSAAGVQPASTDPPAPR